MKPIHRLMRALMIFALCVWQLATPASAAASAGPPKPTVILVHGAFAESASWNAVVRYLRARDYPVIAAANPLRGLASDAAFVGALVSSVEGPVVLVGHSYGGSVISVAAHGQANVRALVFVAAFAPDTGESAVELSSRFPGSTLGQALAPPVVLPDGARDLYIAQDKFWSQFAADVPSDAGRLMAASQRPVTEGALAEGATQAAWKTIPSWFVYGDADKNIPPAALAFMAQRAKAVKTVVARGASHSVLVSRPHSVGRIIVEAASSKAGEP